MQSDPPTTASSIQRFPHICPWQGHAWLREDGALKCSNCGEFWSRIEQIEQAKQHAHDLECESAAMAALKERKRSSKK